MFDLSLKLEELSISCYHHSAIKNILRYADLCIFKSYWEEWNYEDLPTYLLSFCNVGISCNQNGIDFIVRKQLIQEY